MKPKSIRNIRRRKQTFCSLRHEQDLAHLLEVPAHKLQLHRMRPRYDIFSVPKKDGSKRWIENPAPALKKIQKRLNYFLQAVYYGIATPAAYGFMIHAKKDPDPRNILTNAQRHLGCQYLYNADIEDFFHSIHLEQVYQIFITPPFDFQDDLARLLAELVCHQDRLPMGAPTSPVLSNLACIALDQQLQALADWAGWVYTRFVDDMSFSSTDPMKEENIGKILTITQEHNFQLNPDKVRYLEPRDTKTVTGLVLGKQVQLPEDFLAQLQQEILKLSYVLQVQAAEGVSSKWVQTYQQKVEGMLTFAAFIKGDNDPVILDAEAKLIQAQQPPIQEYGAMSWLEFEYI